MNALAYGNMDTWMYILGQGGTEETDVGSISDGDTLVDLGCSRVPTMLLLKHQI